MGNKIISHSKPTLGKEEEIAVLEVIRSGQISQGKKVAQFEKLMADYIGKKYAVAVNSGLAALHLSLIALNIKKGDEVILPSYTCDALLNAVLYLAAKPKIVDVEYDDGRGETFTQTYRLHQLKGAKVPVQGDWVYAFAALYVDRAAPISLRELVKQAQG